MVELNCTGSILMIITYQENGYFRLQSGALSLSVDPTNNRGKSDITLRTQVPASIAEAPADEIAFPGEYEIKNIEVNGFLHAPESDGKTLKTVYLVRWEEMKFVFLGAIAAFPEAALMKEISDPDVLFVPAGGVGVLSVNDAAHLVRQLEPSVAVPFQFKHALDLSKSLGQNGGAAEKFVFKKKDLVPKEGKVVTLEARAGAT